MEIKINKEIRTYSESVVLGLSARQFVFSCLALICSMTVYFLLRDVLPKEVLSWAVILAAVPGAFLGFFTYHGMSAEDALFAYIKSEILEKRFVTFTGRNLYAEILEIYK